jgi:hypothetical protein
VHVVAAGVHYSNLLTVVFGGHSRCKWNVGQFCNRQCIHVSAQRYHGPRERTAQQTNHTCMSDFGPDLDAETSQVVCNEPGRAKLPVT